MTEYLHFIVILTQGLVFIGFWTEKKEREKDRCERETLMGRHLNVLQWGSNPPPFGAQDPLTTGRPGQGNPFTLHCPERVVFPQGCHEIYWHRVFHLALQLTCFEFAAYMCNI